MKKLFAIVLVTALMTTLVVAHADDPGVQIIGGDESAITVTLDDLVIDAPIEISDYATITPVEFLWREMKNESRYKIARLSLNVLNTTGKAIDYIKSASARAVFNDSIVFDTETFPGYSNGSLSGVRQGDVNSDNLIDRDKQYAIGPYDIGEYHCYVLLPIAVIESKDPLRMEITLGELELTYHIRK